MMLSFLCSALSIRGLRFGSGLKVLKFTIAVGVLHVFFFFLKGWRGTKGKMRGNTWFCI